ncbi:hypothetical protein D9Q98_000805 [Chlorella vulgaris]|uniref:Interferon-related developmental regulator N-terminal domain-containing protein n=1 Tax=Chlorella vulgaris TaxID=3077 RepID=A0A9D4TZ04_CHLVU|nr:hypothetical protein D9Q98_000805 [Chlorella vulgaris]
MGRRKSSLVGGSEYDAESQGSLEHGSRASGGRRGQRDDEEEIEVDPFEAAVELLYEKRATVRESALSALVSLLAQFRYDDCAFREATLTQLFLSSIRRGKEVESCLAAKALGLHVTTLGASSASEGIYKEAEPLLEPVALTGRSSATRVAVVEALSVLCFVGSEGTTESLHTMQTMWRVVLGGWKKSAAAAAVVAALRAWAFLLTTVPSYHLDSHFVETHLGLLAQLLNGGDVEVRSAAGEAVALLWQMGDLNSLPESPRPGRSSSIGSSTYNSLVAMAVGSPRTPRLAAAVAAFDSPGSTSATLDSSAEQAATVAAGVDPHLLALQVSPSALPMQHQAQPQQQQQQKPAEDEAQQQQQAVAGEAEEAEDEEEEEDLDSLEAIVERMRDLAKNRGDASRLNKGDRASSRGTFRDLLAIIEGSYVPEQKIKLRHGDQLVVIGLPDNIRFNYLRAYLADAFQSHMQGNELLHEVFRFQPAMDPEERLTPLEKRMFRSKSSSDVRDRTELRRKERSQMANYKHSSLAET